ncbi:hypothetical protein, partial [Vibrio vulnificus]
MRSEPVGSMSDLRTFKRSNGTTYYATPENSYAWNMIAFTNDIKALQEAEAASVDLTTVTLEAVALADYQDAEKRAELLKKYAYQ